MDASLIVLKDQFQRAFLAAGLKPPHGVFEALAARYGEPQRAYHTLQHIAEGLAQLKLVRAVPLEVTIAWWFHDAIYDPKRSDNEQKSAAWAGAVMGTSPLTAKIEKLILATKHGSIPSEPAARLLVDVDLSILATPEPRYSEYERQVRQEYAFVDDATYKAERFKILRGFFDRAYLYMTPEFRNLETRARKNIERSINAMIVAKK